MRSGSPRPPAAIGPSWCSLGIRSPTAVGSIVVAALTRTRRGLVSELVLMPDDGVPTESVVNFDNVHTIPRSAFRRRVTTLSPARMAQACTTLQAATGC